MDNTPSKIIPLHRGVRPTPVRDLHAIFDQPRVEFQPSPEPRRSVLEKISDALGSERMFGFSLGFYSGVMFGCASLIFWLAVMK
jgi:hypothetical protein